jgi:hypothetical protein
MTKDQKERLAKLATLIAIEAPVRRGKHSVTTNVDWSFIDGIRAILEESGSTLDWRKACKEYRRMVAERRQGTGESKLWAKRPQDRGRYRYPLIEGTTK